MSMLKTVAVKNQDSKWWEAKAAPAKTQTKSIQTITFSTNTFNDKERTFVAIASTPIIDRYGDTIQQEGWLLENFLKNPVIPWAHDYWQPPVGRATEIGINAQGNLQFKYQATPKGVYPFADTIWELYRNQFMFAFSVGFTSIEAEGDWQNGYDFKQCELHEISAVVVPANPQAVALAFDKGLIDQAQLADLKEQLTHGIKNVDELIAKQTQAGEKDTKAKITTTEKPGDHSKSTSIELSFNKAQVADIVDTINKAAERLEMAAKSAQNNKDSTDEEASKAKSLTTDTDIVDTKGMATKAGAALSKANKDKLKAIYDDLSDVSAKCQTHMTNLSELLQLEVEDDEEAKAATKVEHKDASKADKVDETGESESAKATNDDEQQQGDDNAAKGEGDVNSGAKVDETKANEGADHKAAGTATADKADEAEDEELVDPDNLTPEQAEKIAAAVNDELDNLKK